MALSGAFKLVPDEPGNIVVVICCDSAFKYASSVVKYLPGLSARELKSAAPRNALLDKMVENGRCNPDLTIDIEAAHTQWQEGAASVMGAYTEKRSQ